MTTATVVELPANLRSPMLRKVNHGLMVTYINADLFNRAGLDVRKSVVLYDDGGVFVAATANMPSTEVLAALYERTEVRYYSKGIK